MVDLVEMEAMLLRAKVARKLVRKNVLKGEEALALIVIPPPALLAETLRIVEEKGVRPDTVKMFGRRATADRGESTAEAEPGVAAAPVEASPEAFPAQEIVTLDDLVAQH